MKRRTFQNDPAMQTALQALQKIELHEEECGKRLTEAMYELKALRVTVNGHSARWEKLAWLVVGTVLATAITHIVGVLM